MFKTVFLVQNRLLNLCSSAVDSQRLLCSQKAGVKCSYLSFLAYKVYYIQVINLRISNEKANLLVNNDKVRVLIALLEQSFEMI